MVPTMNDFLGKAVLMLYSVCVTLILFYSHALSECGCWVVA
jgi:hypothetical protein